MDTSHMPNAALATLLLGIDYFAWMASYTGIAGYFAVIVALIIAGLGMPIPEDIILIAGGWVSFEAGHSVWPMIATGLIGIMAGDSTSFLLGRRFGLALTGHPLMARVLTVDRIERVKVLFAKHGQKILSAARFMPGVRTVVFFTAGAIGVPYWKFFLFDGLAALVSAPLWIVLGYRYGHQVVLWAEESKWVIAGLVIIGIGVWFARRVRSKRAAPVVVAEVPAEPGRDAP